MSTVATVAEPKATVSYSLAHLFKQADIWDNLVSAISTDAYASSFSLDKESLESYVDEQLSNIEVTVRLEDYSQLILNEDLTLYCVFTDIMGHLAYVGNLIANKIDVLHTFHSSVLRLANLFPYNVNVFDNSVFADFVDLYGVLDVFNVPAIEMETPEQKERLMHNIVRMANFSPVLYLYLSHKRDISNYGGDDSASIHEVMTSLLNYIMSTSFEVIRAIPFVKVNLENIPTMLSMTNNIVSIRGSLPITLFSSVFSDIESLLGVSKRVTVAANQKRRGQSKLKQVSPKHVIEILKSIRNDLMSALDSGRVNSGGSANADSGGSGSDSAAKEGSADGATERSAPQL